MGKRRILFAILVAALLALLAYTELRPSEKEPVYGGITLSGWLARLLTSGTNQQLQSEPISAIHKIGTNAVPSLLQMLRTHDSPLKIRMLTWVSHHSFGWIHHPIPYEHHLLALQGFAVLGPRATNAVPELIKILDQNSSTDDKVDAGNVLGFIGPGAKAAIPSLLRVVPSTNISLHSVAILALAEIHADPDTVVPVLIKALRDHFDLDRYNAAFGLQNFRGDAKSAVPVLVELLNDPNVNSNEISPLSTTGLQLDVRAKFKYALKQIDPETYARVLTNTPQVPTPVK